MRLWCLAQWKILRPLLEGRVQMGDMEREVAPARCADRGNPQPSSVVETVEDSQDFAVENGSRIQLVRSVNGSQRPLTQQERDQLEFDEMVEEEAAEMDGEGGRGQTMAALLQPVSTEVGKNGPYQRNKTGDLLNEPKYRSWCRAWEEGSFVMSTGLSLCGKENNSLMRLRSSMQMMTCRMMRRRAQKQLHQAFLYTNTCRLQSWRMSMKGRMWMRVFSLRVRRYSMDL